MIRSHLPALVVHQFSHTTPSHKLHSREGFFSEAATSQKSQVQRNLILTDDWKEMFKQINNFNPPMFVPFMLAYLQKQLLRFSSDCSPSITQTLSCFHCLQASMWGNQHVGFRGGESHSNP